jgi:hypothetical protein
MDVAPVSVAPAPFVPVAGRTVADLVPALFGMTDASWLPAPVHGARAVVLLVLDGLGAHALDDHPDALPTLLAMDGVALTTVLPATTSAALSAITTGTPPAEHGIVGYRMVVDDHVLNVLRWTVEGTERIRPPEPHVVQRRPAFRGRPIPVVTKAEFKGSGFTRAHMGDGPFWGWRTASVLVEHCRRLVREGAPFVYAYFPGVDEVAHEFGLHDDYYRGALAEADAVVAALLEVLPNDVALLVTADHGQVHLERDAWVDTAELAPLVHLQAGDARFRHLHARSGAARELAEECRTRWSDIAWVRTRRELLQDGWLGGTGPGPAAARLGDVVLMPFAPVGFVDPALPREQELRSAHGAPTEAELLVPCRAARGYGRGHE